MFKGYFFNSVLINAYSKINTTAITINSSKLITCIVQKLKGEGII